MRFCVLTKGGGWGDEVTGRIFTRICSSSYKPSGTRRVMFQQSANLALIITNECRMPPPCFALFVMVAVELHRASRNVCVCLQLAVLLSCILAVFGATPPDTTSFNSIRSAKKVRIRVRGEAKRRNEHGDPSRGPKLSMSSSAADVP